MPAPPRARAAAFTLIEIMVVLLVIAVTLGVVGLNLARDDRDRVRDEADRLALALTAARDDSILQGRILAVQFQPDGYQFVYIDPEGKWSPMTNDDSFTPRRLPEGMTLTVEIEGSPATERESGLVFDPTGPLPKLTLTLRLGDARWLTQTVTGSRLRSINPEAARGG